MAEDLITITVPVAGRPDCADWEGARKIKVSPRTVTLHYRPGRVGVVRAEVTGPWMPARPGIVYDRPGDMTVLYYDDTPEPWPAWVRNLAVEYQPCTPAVTPPQ
ncbi:hypothetical protein AMK17_25295 [Streptomyces sp. CB00072]|uniref:hypothetical protein n=1 Tax=Streptomyces sp. CB00072 TaxID=1703928 RepID=UPI000939C41A|nr:hypothetical protein [Streptomyces sp. CB00072]OKI54321.1 hypothetical protein AMK17_25295 [Streptomyces sp. CB00072]